MKYTAGSRAAAKQARGRDSHVVASEHDGPRAEIAGAELRARLAHLTRVLSMHDLAGLIAHEIAQPLGAMLLHASACQRWLAQDPPRIDEARAAAERIVRDGNRARTVVETVRETLPQCPPSPSPVDLNVVIRDALELARGEVAAHAIELRCDFGMLPEVVCDGLQILQVVLNLTSNAIESMADVNGPRILVVSTAHEPAEGAVVKFRDSGVGLDPETANRMFTPMFTTKPGAFGLGLPICRRIVEAHGGTLWAGPNDDRGASFCFSLPVA
jgi:signal transduction histidine kinase